MIFTEQAFTAKLLKREEQALFKAVLDEAKTGKSGYYDLPVSQDDVLDEIDAYMDENKTFLDSIDSIAVIGTGGSSLGAKAINHALRYKIPAKQLIFLESTDPLKLTLEMSKIALRRTLFLVISKSGTTIETISIFKYILGLTGVESPAVLSRHFLFITDEGSRLQTLGKECGVRTFAISPNVGGRFSVLSAVGLVPLALAGYDIKSLLDGARELYESFIEEQNDRHDLMKKAVFYASHAKEMPVNVLFSYSSLLSKFNEWYVQLWGESLGKLDAAGNSRGLTPIGLVGPVDQHSFLQLIMEGPRDKTVTFIEVKHFAGHHKIPKITLPGLESTDFVNGKRFSKLINRQCQATMESVVSRGVPTDMIVLNQLNEQSLGYLIYYFELLTSLVGIIFEINTYDQPGVEVGKRILRGKFNE